MHMSRLCGQNFDQDRQGRQSLDLDASSADPCKLAVDMVNFTRYGDSELIGIGLCRESDVYTLSEEGVSRLFYHGILHHFEPCRKNISVFLSGQ